MIAALKTLVAGYRIWLIGGALILAALAGWRAHKMVIDAERTDALRAAINDHLDAEKRSFTQGMNLETGLNDYRTATRELNRKVQDANMHDGMGRFDADSVQRTARRIAAGKAARQRTH